MLRRLTFSLFTSLLFATGLNAQDSCDVDGGTITLASGGGDSTAICAGDGMADPLDVYLAGASFDFGGWIITDADLNILGLPPAPPFDLEGAGGGTCLIWHVAFEGRPEGLAVGANAADITGCYDLSNPITVARFTDEECAENVADAGGITLANGTTGTSICVDDMGDPLEIIRDGNSRGANRAFVITDDQNNILALPPDNGPFDLNGAGPGTCLIWYLAYPDGLQGLMAGNNISDLEGTFDLSNPITVQRFDQDCNLNLVEGGTISLAGGSVDTSICIDGVDNPLTVERDGAAVGTNRAFVITDDSGTILALPPNDGPFNLEGAGTGTCLIWYLAYAEGIGGLQMGGNVDSLDGSFDFSNPITVVRHAPDGGLVSTASGDTTMIANAGDVLVPVTFRTAATALSYWYVITDDSDNILDFADARMVDTLDLSGAPVGVCRIWGWSYRGEADPIMGESITTLTDGGCEAISMNFITVNRVDSTTSVAPPLEDDQVAIFPNPVRQSINLELRRLTRGETTLRLMDVTGRMVRDLRLDDANGRRTMEVSGLPGGTYLLRVTNDGKVLTRRVVKL